MTKFVSFRLGLIIKIYLSKRHYVGIYDDSAYIFLNSIGITKEFIKENLKGCFMLRHDIHYLNEVHFNEKVSTYIRILNISNSKKRLHFNFYMLKENEVSSFCEGIVAFANLKKRTTETFPIEILEKLEKMKKEHENLEWKQKTNLILEK